jgi:cullin 3
LDFKVSVLASGFWPASVHYQEEESIKLPHLLKSLKEEFETYYFEAHTGRTLTWNYALGSCEVKVTGFAEPSTHEFTVSPLQCIAMLAFSNGRKTLTFIQLLEATGIPREDLKRHMISMAVPKFQLFIKTGPKREFLDEDVYEINSQFKSKMRKIKIPLVSMSSSNSTTAGRGSEEGGNVTAVPASVLEARNVMMDATIVRIMKSRKRFEHNNLVAEVFRQLRFKPTPQDVKKRIEALIERECEFAAWEMSN